MATNPVPKQSYPSSAEMTIGCDNGYCSAPSVTVAKNGKVTIKSPNFTCQVHFDSTDYFKGTVHNPSTVTPTAPLELKIKDKVGKVTFTVSGGPCISATPPQTNVIAMASAGGSALSSSNEIVIGS